MTDPTPSTSRDRSDDANPPPAVHRMGTDKPRHESGGSAFDDLLARGREVLKTPTGKTVATGAAIGAVAGVVLPFVSLPLGAIVGGAVAYARRRK